MPTFAREDSPVIEQHCVPTSCVSLDELEATLGFRPAQPSYIPDRFGLFNQGVSSAAPAASDRPFDPTTAVMEYRLLSSPFVPSFVVVETVVNGVSRVELSPTSADCARRTNRGTKTIFFGEGVGGTYSGDDLAHWSVCIGAGPDNVAAFSAYFTHENVLVEVKALPESGISLEDALKIAESIRFESRRD